MVADVEHAAQRTLKPNLEAELCPGFNFDLFEDETGAAGGGTARGAGRGAAAQPSPSKSPLSLKTSRR